MVRLSFSELCKYFSVSFTAQAKLVGLIKSLTELQSKLVECTSSKHPDAPRLEFQSPNLAMTPEHQTPINVEHAKSTIMQALQQNHERLQRFRY